MGNSESGGCDSSSTECFGGRGIAVISHDGNGFSIQASSDGFTISGGPYADVNTRSNSIDSHGYLTNMVSDMKSPVTEHVHTSSLAISAITDSIDGGCRTQMRADAGQFNHHIHNPINVNRISIETSSNPFYGGECNTK